MPYSALEPRRDERVMHAVDGEGRERQHRLVIGGPEQVHAGDALEPGTELVCELTVVRHDRLPADARQLVDRGVERDRAEHVGRAGFLAFGRIAPHDLVEVHEVDGAAAGEERIAFGEGGARTDERARAERRVHLVAAPRHEVGGRGDRPVRRELGRIEEYGHAALVRDRDDRRRSAASSR